MGRSAATPTNQHHSRNVTAGAPDSHLNNGPVGNARCGDLDVVNVALADRSGRKITAPASVHHLPESSVSALQSKRITGLRNGRRVGADGGRLKASRIHIVCAAWRHSLAS